METKKSIVKSVNFKKEGDGQYGKWYSFTVTFENGDSGDYLGKSNPQDKFIEGKEVEYTIEAKVNGQYTNYSIKPVQAQGNFPKANPAHEHKRTALKLAIDVWLAGKIEGDKVESMADRLFNYLSK